MLLQERERIVNIDQFQINRHRWPNEWNDKNEWKIKCDVCFRIYSNWPFRYVLKWFQLYMNKTRMSFLYKHINIFLLCSLLTIRRSQKTIFSSHSFLFIDIWKTMMRIAIILHKVKLWRIWRKQLTKKVFYISRDRHWLQNTNDAPHTYSYIHISHTEHPNIHIHQAVNF